MLQAYLGSIFRIQRAHYNAPTIEEQFWMQSFLHKSKCGKLLRLESCHVMTFNDSCFPGLTIRSGCNWATKNVICNPIQLVPWIAGQIVVYSLNWCLLLGFCCDTWESMKEKTLPVSPLMDKIMPCNPNHLLCWIAGQVWLQLFTYNWCLLLGFYCDRTVNAVCLPKNAKNTKEHNTYQGLENYKPMTIIQVWCSMFSKNIQSIFSQWSGLNFFGKLNPNWPSNWENSCLGFKL